MRHKKIRVKFIKAVILLGLSFVFILAGIIAIWVATLKMPDLNSFENRKVIESTKIYDRTGSILLYDTGTNVKLSIVPLAEISPFIQKATIAIEDANFYTNIGIEPTSIIRAVLADITTGDFGQGGSTITQQVIKNSLLTQDKTVTRKIKEWMLAVKLTRSMSKDQILETYLNESPFGGTVYGVEEASQMFFGKSAKDVTLSEAAYLAAIPQAPTYYSPYGTHRDALDARQSLVLSRMKSLGFITDEQYKEAKEEKVSFLSKVAGGIRAPHFVMMVREYLLQKYGEDAVDNGGLRVITSLDYNLQQKAEDVVNRFAPTLAENFNASNAAMVAIDPKTGDVLSMIGSKDYFNKEIDGNFNVALAKRQPGSTFKPFVYAAMFKKGYTPETILFDTPTEFSTYCTPDSKPRNPADDPKKCYSPVEFDGLFPGPMTAKQALAQSRNVPAVKALYLAGLPSAIQTSEDMGITTLTDPNRYGLTLVLGGGEVTLLDLTSAYGVFANDGIRHPYRYVLEVIDAKGETIEKSNLTVGSQVIEADVSRQISNILSDQSARLESLRPIAEAIGRPVSIKTGTTNDYRDVWTVGYAPNLVVGAWAGNNDNSPMQRNVAGLIISPLWGAFMTEAIKEFPEESFKAPPPPLSDGKPVLRGKWQGGVSYYIDSVSGKLATEYTPEESRSEVVFNSVHDILHWVNKDDPRGPIPVDPNQDSQYESWEYSARKWFEQWKASNPSFAEVTNYTIPTAKDDIHTPEKAPKIAITSPTQNADINSDQRLTIQISSTGPYPLLKADVYINSRFVLSSNSPTNISFIPKDVTTSSGPSTVRIVVFDQVKNKAEVSLSINLK